MNDKDKNNKAKVILNSEIKSENQREETIFEDNFLEEPNINFSYNYKGFKKISGWWIFLFLLILVSIPIGIIYILFLIFRSFIRLLF